MSSALLTDRYELTMLQAALQSGRANRRTVFEVFTRQLPAGRRYGVLAGTARVIQAVQDFKFEQPELEFLKSNSIVDAKTIEWLANFKFSGSIRGYPEGDVYFGGSPVLSVEGSFAECVLLETVILSILNFDSAVASAASRMTAAAGGRKLIEMGSRRGHEMAAIAAARSAYIAGFDSTSNLEAGRRYGIPTAGTAAHAFTLLHYSEREAFAAQIATLGEGTTLLVDTYDVANAIRLGVELTSGRLGAIRLDSGDLILQAGLARRLLDELGATSTKIVVTSDLDEFAIAGLAASPVDAYGVGTSLITGSGFPTAGFVYKLVAFEQDGSWHPVAKRSASKLNMGGKKYVYRQVELEKFREVTTLRPRPELGSPVQRDFMMEGASVIGSNSESTTLQARDYHSITMKSLPTGSFRLSKGNSAVEVEFLD